MQEHHLIGAAGVVGREQPAVRAHLDHNRFQGGVTVEQSVGLAFPSRVAGGRLLGVVRRGASVQADEGEHIARSPRAGRHALSAGAALEVGDAVGDRAGAPYELERILPGATRDAVRACAVGDVLEEIVTDPAVEDIVALVVKQGVVARESGEGIVAAVALEVVIADAAVALQRVIAAAADQCVAAIAADEGVVAFLADDVVAAFISGDAVIAEAGVDGVIGDFCDVSVLPEDRRPADRAHGE